MACRPRTCPSIIFKRRTSFPFLPCCMCMCESIYPLGGISQGLGTVENSSHRLSDYRLFSCPPFPIPAPLCSINGIYSIAGFAYQCLFLKGTENVSRYLCLVWKSCPEISSLDCKDVRRLPT